MILSFLNPFISTAEVCLTRFSISIWADFSGYITLSIPNSYGVTIASLCMYSVFLRRVIIFAAPSFFAIVDATKLISSIFVKARKKSTFEKSIF